MANKFKVKIYIAKQQLHIINQSLPSIFFNQTHAELSYKKKKKKSSLHT